MADQLLEQVRDAVEGQIDFEGQRLAEMLTTVLLGAAGIVAFLVGFMQQDIRLALYIGLAGTALTFAVVVPPWPFYNKNPEDWLASHNATSTSAISIDVDGQKVG
ncbi:SPC12-domain-containing protein [Dothidotthia symphoricarpi CBS 119687]|uniref:Signal peptidase complex subunit 1 n=1 Tax=Dothidotthia symphoricarpi CBS 119687 TaxID=1392245 RepID=A0A6A6A9T5_9PLEO|nr:SPC12-domain-containing protein [Dothidotthia symphoricarpi CBS 119687]KAF2128580.1 SPC12-domain-containing protein [Dothidotthia symphoricarpi CBS 119687]